MAESPAVLLTAAAARIRETAKAADQFWDTSGAVAAKNGMWPEHHAQWRLWSPPVASAVAAWLDAAAKDMREVDAVNERTAERAERTGGDGHTWVMHHHLTAPALAVADAVLATPEDT